MAFNLGVRVWIIVIAALLAFSLVILVLKPFVLEPLGLIGSDNCLQIEYWQYNTTVLAHMQPTGYWVWFNGEDMFVYGQPTGRLCSDKGYEPAYLYDIRLQKVLGYVCVVELDQVQEYYKSKNVKSQFIFKKDPSPTFDVYDLLTLFVDKRVIPAPEDYN